MGLGTVVCAKAWTAKMKKMDKRFIVKTEDYKEMSDISSPIADENWAYNYDHMGNRLSATEGADAFSYTANALNQYTFATGQGNLTYDADGNLTSDLYWTYTWDALNRLVDMTPTQEGRVQGYKKHAFTYDYMSRRVRKQVYDWNVTNWDSVPSVDEKYVYDGWSLIAVYDGTSADALIRTYTWGMDGGTGGIGAQLSAKEHAGSRAGKTYLYVYDATGNVTQIVDSADGSVVAKYQYDPFGKTRLATGDGYQDINPFRYQTKFTDHNTGLIYYGYRFYSHGLGRFLNRDPLGEQGGLNLYAFVGNDPVNAREYLGLSVIREGGPDEYHWWREGLNDKHSDGNSNWRKILTQAYNMYYDHWNAAQRNDFQVATLDAYWHQDTNRHDEASLDRAVGAAVETAVLRLMGVDQAPSTPVANPTSSDGIDEISASSGASNTSDRNPVSNSKGGTDLGLVWHNDQWYPGTVILDPIIVTAGEGNDFLDAPPYYQWFVIGWTPGTGMTNQGGNRNGGTGSGGDSQGDSQDSQQNEEREWTQEDCDKLSSSWESGHFRNGPPLPYFGVHHNSGVWVPPSTSGVRSNTSGTAYIIETTYGFYAGVGGTGGYAWVGFENGYVAQYSVAGAGIGDPGASISIHAGRAWNAKNPDSLAGITLDFSGNATLGGVTLSFGATGAVVFGLDGVTDITGYGGSANLEAYDLIGYGDLGAEINSLADLESLLEFCYDMP
jgi:RHS repeat-associated protein